MFDVRQHSLLRSFLAHSGPVTSVIINDTEEYFVTGSSDGMIKVGLFTNLRSHLLGLCFCYDCSVKPLVL